jgi:hypothetical protein
VLPTRAWGKVGAHDASLGKSECSRALGAGDTLFLPVGNFYWIAGLIGFHQGREGSTKYTALPQLPVMWWVVVQHCHVNTVPGSNLGASTVFFGASRFFGASVFSMRATHFGLEPDGGSAV